jgi:mannose-6-phosphate isomerase-like protein (cupin superfamily)
MHVVNQSELPFSVIARELQGEEHGGMGASLIFVDAPPGRGPSLHQHPYTEIFITEEGEATVTAGDETRTVGPGDIVIVPPNTPHSFVNSGDGNLRQLDIHLSPRFITEWLT